MEVREVFGRAGWGTHKCWLTPNEEGCEGDCPLKTAPRLVQRAELARGWGGRGSGSYLMVPLKRTGSCRMMDKRERSVCSGSLAMSMPSMMMRPIER